MYIFQCRVQVHVLHSLINMCVYFSSFFHSFLTHYTANIRMESIHVFGHSQKSNQFHPTHTPCCHSYCNKYTTHILKGISIFWCCCIQFSVCLLHAMLLIVILLISHRVARGKVFFCTQKKAKSSISGWSGGVSKLIVASFLRKNARISYCRSLADDKDDDMIVLKK